jgi:hypothetical protein
MSTPRKLVNSSDSQSASSAEQKSFNALTSSYSAGVKRAYVKNGALSIFMKEGYMGEVAIQGLRAAECVTDIQYGHRDNANHSAWHKSKKDFEIMHSHVLKTTGDKITPEEFKCILDGFVGYGRSYDFQIKFYNRTSTYTQDQCFYIDPTLKILDPMDHAHLLKKYEEYYHGEKLTPGQNESLFAEIQTNMSELYSAVSVRMDEGSKALALAFFNTFLHKYIKPFLIDKSNYSNTKVAWGCEVLSSAFSLALSHSPLQVGFGFILRNTIKPAFLKVGIDVTTAEYLANQLSTLAAITEDPTRLAQLGVNISFAHMGESMAHRLIKQLPKLRKEPAITHTVANEVVANEIPEGLRKRNSRL